MADLDSDVLKILRAVHGPKEPPKKVRFDKDAFLKALNASIQERMPRLTDSGRSALYVYSGSLDLQHPEEAILFLLHPRRRWYRFPDLPKSSGIPSSRRHVQERRPNQLQHRRQLLRLRCRRSWRTGGTSIAIAES